MCTWPIWGWIDVESRRVLGSKLFLAVLAGLLVLNCAFFLYQQFNGEGNLQSAADDYNEKVELLCEMTPEEALDWCAKYQERAYAKMAYNVWDFEGPEEQARQTVIQLQSEYEYLLSYEGYLDKIEANVKRLQSVSLFSDPDSYAYRNTVKTAADFAQMRRVQVTPGHDRAVTAFFEDKWTDYSILILICVVCGLFVAERKEGLWPMIHAAPGGRWRLAVKRTGILFAAAWIGTVLLVGSKILLCGWTYDGLGEWDRILQSIPMFQNVPDPMTIGRFWLLYIAVKAVGAFWIGLVLWAVLSSISNLGLALSAAGLMAGIEFAFTAIPSSSMFAVLRYVNVFSYIDFGIVFPRYLNVPVFDTLISGSDLVLAILPFLCIVFCLINVLITERKYPVTPANRLLRWFDGIQKKLDPILAGGGEARKLLIKRRGLLLLILLALIVSRMEAPPRIYVQWDVYIQFYQEKYAGPVTDEKLALMEQDLVDCMDGNNAKGLRIVLEDAQDAPDGAWIVPTGAYDAVWSDNVDNYQRSTALIALLFLVLITAPIAAQERHSDMTILLRSTSGGRKHLFRKKQLILLLVTSAVWAIVYGMEIIRAITEYGGFYCLGAPAYSLALFQDAQWSVSIGFVLLMFYFSRLLVMLAVAEICYFLSTRCARNKDAILLCCGVILIPAALAAIGSTIGEYISFVLPLGGSELLRLLLG